MESQDQALVKIGEALRAAGYKFATVTPETHRRVLARPVDGVSLRDIFGWNRPTSADSLPVTIREAAQRAGILNAQPPLCTSRVRFSSLYSDLYLHSGFPTVSQDAVFFGPDTYRYARLLRQHVEKARRVVDVGCGSGAGGLCLKDRVETICLADINPLALRYSRINATLQGCDTRVETLHSDILSAVTGDIDLVISNPPYLVDDAERAYRHGGDLLGAGLSVRIAQQALDRLSSGGKLVLYTASPIVDGRDTFWEAVKPIIDGRKHEVFYEEIDPDVFGEELDRPVYQHTDRLAVVGLVVRVR